MRVIEPGHEYEVETYDNNVNYRMPQYARFMKRVGPGYPGNSGLPHAGTNCQEHLRVLIDRVKHLNKQAPCAENQAIIWHARSMLMLFETRAARRHGLTLELTHLANIEELPTCPVCGHIKCGGHS